MDDHHVPVRDGGDWGVLQITSHREKLTRSYQPGSIRFSFASMRAAWGRTLSLSLHLKAARYHCCWRICVSRDHSPSRTSSHQVPFALPALVEIGLGTHDIAELTPCAYALLLRRCLVLAHCCCSDGGFPLEGRSASRYHRRGDIAAPQQPPNETRLCA